MYRGISIISALILILAFVGSANAQVSPGFLSLPQQSVAATRGPLASLVNPAGLGVGEASSLDFLYSYDKNAHFGNWGWAFGGDDMSFIGEYMRSFPNDQERRNRYTWGMGGGEHGVYFGAAYSWTSGVDRENNWDMGMLLRPYRFLSFGVVARGVNNPRIYDEATRLQLDSNVGWDLGLAVRPIALFGPPGKKGGNMLTVTADANLRQFVGIKTIGGAVTDRDPENYDENIGFKIGAVMEFVPGITGHVDYLTEIDEGILKRDATLWGGVSFSFGNAAIGSYQEEGTGHGTSWMSFSELYKPTILHKRKTHFVKIKISGPIVEYQRSSGFFRPKYRTIYAFNKEIEKYIDDPEIVGILLELGYFGGGWAKTQEMRQQLVKFKEAGKQIVVYMESASNKNYYLASVADKIYLSPSSSLYLTGLTAHMMFLKETFDKIGLDPELEHIGDYKSASDMLTRKDMSDAQKEATDAILDDLFKEFVTAIAEGRSLEVDDVKNLLDEGPFTSQGALDAKLVDKLLYSDQLEDEIKELEEGKKKPGFISAKRYAQKQVDEDEWNDLRQKAVAIVYGTGGITTGNSSDGGLFGGESMGSNTIAKAIRNARNDKEVKAIVFRVDSPGGSMLGSELILREVIRCTEGDDKKPIIVSMSDVAGSGGYYVACKADKIVAQPGTITGSIGIIGGKISYHRFQRKIGVNTATLRRGKRSDYSAGYRSFTDEEWEKLRADLKHNYDIFLTHVAEGREQLEDTAAVNKIAQGRIWSGERAKEIGLIDETGGLTLAIEMARRAGGIKDDEKFTVKMYPKPRSFDIHMGMQTLVRSALPDVVLEAADAIADETRWDDGEMLMLMPFRIEIE